MDRTADIEIPSTADGAMDPASRLGGPALARRFVARFLGGAPTRVDDEVAALLMSEIVTNAMRHSEGAVAVHVAMNEVRLHVEVHDGAAALPEVGTLADLQAQSGRGLAIVAALAAAWGVIPSATGGKSVWFDLPVFPLATTP